MGGFNSEEQMKNTVLPIFAVIIYILFIPSIIASEAPQSYVPNEIIVKFRESATKIIEQQSDRQTGLFNLSAGFTSLNSKYPVKQIKPLLKDFRTRHQQLQSLRKKNRSQLTQKEKHMLKRIQRASVRATIPALDRIYKIQLDCPDDQSLQEALEAYRNNPDVEYAELNHIVSMEGIPNDPAYSEQWALSKIDAPGAWDFCTGSDQIIVAVLDTGVDYNHRDLSSNIWTNEKELNGQEGIDDDNNGYIDDIHGYNFIYNSSDPIDDNGHGTHCAGIIAAQGNNHQDATGVCWNTKIMAIKFMDFEGVGSTYDAEKAIIYAVENGADVLSNSWSAEEKFSNELQSLKETIEYAQSQGLIIVAAAGNQNKNNEFRYPAGYQNVISVAATDTEDNRWIEYNSGQGSNYGDWVDIAAPGVDILSLWAANTISEGMIYDQHNIYHTGTSMACPHVAGACALLLSANPLMTFRDVYEILMETTDPISPDICRSGRLNLSKAMQAVVPSQGYINFDQDYYTYTSTVGLLLADRDLKGRRTQQAIIRTEAGDLESVILFETETSFGVFTGSISIASGPPNQHDGTLQASSGEVITAIYIDPDAASGNSTSTDIAFVDYELPSLIDLHTQTQDRQATITFTTNETTKAKIRYGPTSDQQKPLSKEDPTTTATHTVTLISLSPETRYDFVIDLTDEAGNTNTADANGSSYSFTTLPDKGLSVPSLYPTIQAAIDNASDGDTIWVSDGRYTGTGNKNIDFKGKSITIKSENGPENCLIDCQGYGRGINFQSGEDSNSVLDGFTIFNGYVDGFGGGINCSRESNPAIKNCIITDNLARMYGGGMYIDNSNPILINCTFTRNSAGSSLYPSGNGGGIYNINSNPVLTDCSFFTNFAMNQGGGMYNDDYSNPVLTKCTFIENSSKYGGGIYNFFNSNTTLINCLFVDNSAESGGAIQNASSKPTETSVSHLSNCTLFRNTANNTGGGIKNSLGGASVLNNCILWNNSDINGTNESAQIDNSSSGQNSAANYCCIQGLTTNTRGIGNIDSDPLFFNADADDFHLKSTGWRWDRERNRWHYDEVTSPCIDAGNPGSPLNTELTATADDPTNRWGINRRINIGTFGGTDEASLAPLDWNLLADLNNDGNVNMKDFSIQTRSQMQQIDAHPGDLDRNGIVETADLVLLAHDWLKFIHPPFVNITSPQSGSVVDGDSTEVIVSADASDTNGRVVKVEFFADGERIGEDSDGSDGWSITWTQHPFGEYYITARATDNGGLATTSNRVVIWIVPPRN
jgi:thermitase